MGRKLGPSPQSIDRKRRIQDITNKDSWIIEGVSKQALAKADRVIFLDISTKKCVMNITKRFVKNGLKTRPELPKNCPEHKGFIKAMRIALIFKKVTRPSLINELESGKMIRFNHDKSLSRHTHSKQELLNLLSPHLSTHSPAKR